jgi:hypothetical protein
MMYSERGIPAAELEMYESEYKAAMADLDLEKLFMVLDGYEEEMGSFEKKYEMHHLATINGDQSQDDDSKGLLSAATDQDSLSITLDSSIGDSSTSAAARTINTGSIALAMAPKPLSSSLEDQKKGVGQPDSMLSDQYSPPSSLLSDEKSVATQSQPSSSSPHREKRETSGHHQQQGHSLGRDDSSPMLKKAASLRKGYEKTLHHLSKRNVPSQSYSPQQTKDLHLHADDASTSTSQSTTTATTTQASSLTEIEDFSLLRDKLVERLYQLPRTQLSILQELGGAWEDIQRKHETASTTTTTTTSMTTKRAGLAKKPAPVDRDHHRQPIADASISTTGESTTMTTTTTSATIAISAHDTLTESVPDNI